MGSFLSPYYILCQQSSKTESFNINIVSYRAKLRLFAHQNAIPPFSRSPPPSNSKSYKVFRTCQQENERCQEVLFSITNCTMNDLMTDLGSRLAPRVRAWHACTYSNFALFAFTTFTEYLITHYKPDNSSYLFSHHQCDIQKTPTSSSPNIEVVFHPPLVHLQNSPDS